MTNSCLCCEYLETCKLIEQYTKFARKVIKIDWSDKPTFIDLNVKCTKFKILGLERIDMECKQEN